MFYIRKEGEAVRQGFNFYPLSDKGSFGCQMLFWKLRVEIRYSKRTGWLHLYCWIRKKPQLPKESYIYIPGYTEELKELYEKRFRWGGKKYEDWSFDD